MSFKRTATALIIIAIVTAVCIGAYLWFNFNSRSNLILVVPKHVQWMYHFQTGKIRKITTGEAPPYLDSLTRLIKNAPVFSTIKEPAEPGIKLHSDLILFGNKYGTYAAFSLTSESRFDQFIENLPKGRFTGGKIETDFCKFVKVLNKPIYIAFKHKALVIFSPKDTSDNLDVIKLGLKIVFDHKDDYSIAGSKALRDMYDADCDVLVYVRNRSLPSHGVILKNQRAKFVSSLTGRDLQAATGLKIFDFVNMGGDKIKKNKTISSTQYLNYTFKAAYHAINQF